ncbi:MAG: DUF86 domain-containing protein [Anaerohalosphaeraceae bacterium]
MKRDFLYLTHIAESIRRIEDYTRCGKEAFVNSTLVQDAVIRNFEIIGEAVKNISDDTLERQPHIPWRQIASFRDVLIHGYMGVDLNEVWNVIERDLPPLKEAVNALLHS